MLSRRGADQAPGGKIKDRLEREAEIKKAAGVEPLKEVPIAEIRDEVDAERAKAAKATVGAEDKAASLAELAASAAEIIASESVLDLFAESLEHVDRRRGQERQDPLPDRHLAPVP